MPDPLEPELRRIAAALVDEAPAPPPMPRPAGQPTTFTGGSRRRLRMAMVLGAAAVVAASLLIAAVRSDRNGTSVTAGPDAVEAPTADRSMPDSSGPAERLVLRSAHEVLRDGSLRKLAAPPDLSLNWAEGLPDGRVVMLGSRDLMPGVSRRDGANVEAVAFPLVVTDVDGSVQVDRDVRVRGEWVELLAVTATEAILHRSDADAGGGPIGRGNLVAHNFATGAERRLGQPVATPRAGDVAGAVVMIVSADAQKTGASNLRGRCRLETFRLDGNPAGHTEVALPDCSDVQGVNVSPDGRSAAVVYGIHESHYEIRLTVVPTDGAAPHSDEFLGHPVHCTAEQCAGLKPFSYLGEAWLDNNTLRVALNDLQRSGQREEVTAESVELITRTIPQ